MLQRLVYVVAALAALPACLSLGDDQCQASTDCPGLGEVCVAGLCVASEGDLDARADTDPDAATDADTDAETDAGPDADAGTDADPDVGTDADTDAGTDTDTAPDTAADTDASPDTAPDAAPDADTDPDAAPDSDSGLDTDAATTNACGGTAPLDGSPGEPCAQCGDAISLWACDGADAVACATPVCSLAGFVELEPGTFTMGSPESELYRATNEPEREVTLTRAVWVSTTEVTQAEYRAALGTNPSWGPDCDTCPVTMITLADAARYANARSAAEGLSPCYIVSDTDIQVDSPTLSVYDCEGYRLPTEAEWEGAARAGTNTATYLGAVRPDALGCSNGALQAYERLCGDGVRLPRAVASGLANPLGLHDVLGNVGEWTWDQYVYQSSATTDPESPPFSQAVVRGASYTEHEGSARAARRIPRDVDYPGVALGMRVVRSVEPSVSPSCAADERNACGGCGALLAAPGSDCGGCGGGVVECDGAERTRCVGATPHNACGGCATLAPAPGDACDACGGARAACVDADTAACPAVCPPEGLVYVPAGTAQVGSLESEPRVRGDEPIRQIEVTRPLWVSATEVTQLAWFDVMGTRPSAGAVCDRCPVERVSMRDAFEYANRLSVAAGLAECYDLSTTPPGVNTASGSPVDCVGYRLPTGAEWEYFARAGTDGSVAAQSVPAAGAECDLLPAVGALGWYCANSSGFVRPVGARAANPFGLFDTVGNVAELIGEAYGYPPSIARPIDPFVAWDAASTFEFRGGGFSSGITAIRSASRGCCMDWSSVDGGVGVRVVRTAPTE